MDQLSLTDEEKYGRQERERDRKRERKKKRGKKKGERVEGSKWMREKKCETVTEKGEEKDDVR